MKLASVLSGLTKSWVLFIVIVASAGLGGGAYAAWTASLHVEGTVQTGDVNVVWDMQSDTEFVGILDPATGQLVNSPIPPEKDVADCLSSLQPEQVAKTVTFQVINAYPSYTCEITLGALVTGSVPVHVSNVKREVIDAAGAPVLDKELNMNVDLMRKNEVEPGIFDCNPEQPVETGTQLHRGDRFCAIISIHATEAAQQNHTYTGSLWIDLIQWNFSGQQPQSAPQVAANNAVVTVTEGSGASNAGTFSNSGPGIVTVSASIGAVTQIGTQNGTWSWSFSTTDGPDDSQIVTVTAKDPSGAFSETTFDLTVNSAAPTIVLTGASSANEGETAAYNFTTSDPGADTFVRLNQSCGLGGVLSNPLFDPSTGAGSFDCLFTGDPASTTVSVQIGDSDGAVGNLASIPVTVTPTVNLAPSITTGAAVSVPENQTSVLDVQSTDPNGETENGGGLTYSTTGGADQALFSINAATGVLRFVAAPDFENPGDANGDNTYEVVVTVTDAGLLTGNQDMAVTVTDVNENIGMTITLQDVLVGVGRTNNGTITLGSPAPVGGVSISLSLDTAIATVDPTAVVIPEGSTEGAFVVTGVSVGMTTLTGTGTGVSPANAQVEVTDRLISIDDIPTVAPDEAADLPLSITTPAPPGGVTIQLQSLDPTIAITDATVFVAEGQVIPATNPQITGVRLGTTSVRATAVNFAPATRDVLVALDVTLTPVTLDVPQLQTRQVSVQISAPAPAGGLTLTLSLDDPTLATLPSSILIPAGQTLSGPIDITAGSVLGTTILRADGSGLVEDTSTINIVAVPLAWIAQSSAHAPHIFVGVDLQTTAFVRLAVAPPGPVDVIVSVPANSGVLLSLSPTAVGTETLTVAIGQTGTFSPTFYIQGIVEGDDIDDDVPLTLQVFDTGTTNPAGYVPQLSDVDVGPTGFDFNSANDLVTTTFSNDTLVGVRTALLFDSESGVLHNRRAQQNVRGGHPGITIDLTSSLPAVGTLSTPVVIAHNRGTASAVFDPLTAGTTVLDLTQPTGYVTPANGILSRNAIVDAPNIWLTISGSPVSSVDIGRDLQVLRGIRLEVTAPAPGVDVTVEIIDPTVALISADPTIAGTGSITFPLVTGTFAPNIYIQGLALNQGTEIRVTAPGYDQWVATIQVIDSGFYILSPTVINTTAGAANTLVRISAAALNPNQTVKSSQQLRGGLTVDIVVNSSDPGVGTIVTSPVVFSGGDGTKSATFDPIAVGVTTVSIVQPAGFTPVAARTSITATVN